jgi:hypothetical protein
VSDTQGYFGQLGEVDVNDDFNAHRFLMKQLLAETRDGIPVKIMAVHGGGVGPAPTVDVQPLVTQIDSQGNATPHGVVYGIPATRNQGGGSAVINDPVVGDVYFMKVADRDISSLKANAGAQSNPGSFRRHDLADGVLDRAFLNPATPTQYLYFNNAAGGFTLADKFGNIFVSSNGMVQVTTPIFKVVGQIQATGNITAGEGTGDQVDMQGHVHTLVTPGAGDSGPPLPGS